MSEVKDMPASALSPDPTRPREGQPVLALIDVVRRYRQVTVALEVLRGVSLSVRPGELVGLVGPSGAGKSTLLHLAGLLERPDGGEVYFNGTPTATLSEDARTRLRCHTLGFVYQYHHLLPEFSALENVILPQMIAERKESEAMARALELLAWVGLGDRAHHRPGQLSGGEQQRVAIIRALANTPQLLIADEPTGNLDQHTAAEVFAVLLALVRGSRLGALVATHNLELAAQMDRVLELRDGQLIPWRH